MAEEKTITVNRRAYHDYHILETLEAGIALTGTEIKSIRGGMVNIKDAYARIEKGELWLFNAHVARYEPGSIFSHEPERPRKLLVHRKQLGYLVGAMSQKNLTMVPLKLYIKTSGIAKVQLGLAKGKKLYDKRESIARRETEREIERGLKTYRQSH